MSWSLDRNALSAWRGRARQLARDGQLKTGTVFALKSAGLVTEDDARVLRSIIKEGKRQVHKQ